MRTIPMLMSLLLSCSLGLFAQAGDPGADTRAGNASAPTMIGGCLQRSGFQYTVTDKNGKSYNLTGNTGKLSHYVGHQVEITGAPTIKTIDTSEQNAASTVQEVPAFKVKSAKQVSQDLHLGDTVI
jgi:hypothetical protein